MKSMFWISSLSISGICLINCCSNLINFLKFSIINHYHFRFFLEFQVLLFLLQLAGAGIESFCNYWQICWTHSLTWALYGCLISNRLGLFEWNQITKFTRVAAIWQRALLMLKVIGWILGTNIAAFALTWTSWNSSVKEAIWTSFLIRKINVFSRNFARTSQMWIFPFLRYL